ncbi:hypothetical protein YC2023_067024 [Brassica napus]
MTKSKPKKKGKTTEELTPSQTYIGVEKAWQNRRSSITNDSENAKPLFHVPVKPARGIYVQQLPPVWRKCLSSVKCHIVKKDREANERDNKLPSPVAVLVAELRTVGVAELMTLDDDRFTPTEDDGELISFCES